MLKISQKSKKILDALLHSKPKVVAEEFGIEVGQVYYVVHYLRKQVQNAEEFLSLARGTYREILSRRVKSPKIVQIDEEEDY